MLLVVGLLSAGAALAAGNGVAAQELALNETQPSTVKRGESPRPSLQRILAAVSPSEHMSTASAVQSGGVITLTPGMRAP